jgi:hypothetical protein
VQRADAALVGLRALRQRRAVGRRTGAIGNGVRDAAHGCFVIVNNARSADPADTKKVPIRFSS